MVGNQNTQRSNKNERKKEQLKVLAERRQIALIEQREVLEKKVKESESDDYLTALTGLNTLSNQNKNDPLDQSADVEATKKKRIAELNNELNKNTSPNGQVENANPRIKNVRFAEKNTHHSYNSKESILKTGMKKEEIAKIVGKFMLAGAFAGASLTGGVTIYVSPSFTIPFVGQLIGASALGLIVASTIIGAIVGGILGSRAAYKEYQSSKIENPQTTTVFEKNLVASPNPHSKTLQLKFPNPSYGLG